MSELHWLPIAGTLCGFRGNPNPGSTERAVCVAEVRRNDAADCFDWRAGDAHGQENTEADAATFAEVAVEDGETRGKEGT